VDLPEVREGEEDVTILSVEVFDRELTSAEIAEMYVAGMRKEFQQKSAAWFSCGFTISFWTKRGKVTGSKHEYHYSKPPDDPEVWYTFTVANREPGWEQVSDWLELHIDGEVRSVYLGDDPGKPWVGEAHCGIWGVRRPTFATKEEAKAWCELPLNERIRRAT